jgi:hypothetical protein
MALTGTNKFRATRKRALSLALFLALVHAGCGSEFRVLFDGRHNVSLDHILVTPDTFTIETGHSRQLAATAHYSDSSTSDITSSAVWVSDNGSYVTVDSGRVTAHDEGTATVTATYSGQSAAASVTVTPATSLPDSISIEPAAFSMEAGHARQLTATAHYFDSSTMDVTADAVWSSSNEASATVLDGLVTGVAEGTSIITASYSALEGTASVTVVATDSTWIYWTESTGAIKRMTSEKEGESTLVAVAGVPLDIALDSPGTMMYWTEDRGGTFQINRAALDGSGGETFGSYSSSAYHGPTEIAVDAANDQIYWNKYLITSARNTICTCSTGSFSGDTCSNQLAYPYTFGIALDPGNERIYFTANKYWDVGTPVGSGRAGAMYRSSSTIGDITMYLDSYFTSGPVDMNSAPLRDIAVDSAGNYVYFVRYTYDSTFPQIVRSGLNFGSPQPLVTASGFEIQKLALVVSGGKIYWTSPSDSRIYRADIDDGSGIEVFAELTETPTGIAVLD